MQKKSWNAQVKELACNSPLSVLMKKRSNGKPQRGAHLLWYFDKPRGNYGVEVEEAISQPSGALAVYK